jgi:AcrR family transcriptional regulator
MMKDMTVTDGRRVRGEISRQAVMRSAVDLASVGGLDGLSIGGLASAVSMSKSGIAGLFGTKQDLQLATIAAAAEIFREHAIVPALTAPAGLQRLRAFVDAWIDYSESRVFTGGCFFAAAAAEYRARPGVFRDAVVAQMRRWHQFLAEAVKRAMATGELPADTDPEQLAFEITALLDAANDASLLYESAEPYARARTAIDSLLARR